MPRVSICFSTFNGEKYLQKALDSVKQHTFRNIEIIISADSSTESTLKIAEDFKQQSYFSVFIYDYTPSDIGHYCNFCIEKTNVFLFQDDIFAPDCVNEMVTAFELRQHTGIVACKKSFIIEEKNKSTEMKFFIKKYGNLQQDINPQKNYTYFSISNKLFTNRFFFKEPIYKIGKPTCVIFTKDMYEKTGKFNNSIPQRLDYEYWYRTFNEIKINKH